MKKNHNTFVELSKFWNFVKDNKIIIWALILLMLTIRWECSNETGGLKFSFGCSPIRISDVKEIIK